MFRKIILNAEIPLAETTAATYDLIYLILCDKIGISNCNIII